MEIKSNEFDNIPIDLSIEEFHKKMKTRLFLFTELTTNNKRNFINFIVNPKENFESERLILAKSTKTEDIQEDSEIKFYLQKYLIYNENDTKKLQLINKEFQNIYKKTIKKMNFDEAIIRKLLLTMYSDQIISFKVHKEKEIKFFDDAIKKQVNSKKEKIEENKFDDFIIYTIGVFYVYNPIKEPNDSNDYEKTLNKVYLQLRYLFEKKEYTQIIKDVNKNISFYMQTKKTEEIFNSKEDIKNKCYKILEKIISIKVLCIINKDHQEKKSDFQNAIYTIDNEYFKYFRFKENADDTIYSRNLGRKCRCYIEVKNLEKTKEIFNEINTKFPNNTDMINELKVKIENYEKSLGEKNAKKSFNFHKNLSNILTSEDLVNPFTQWERAKEECDCSNIKVDIGIRNYIMDY